MSFQTNTYFVPKLITVTKSADQTKVSDTTFADDSQLVIPLKANAAYYVTIYIVVNSHATPDFKYDITLPTGAAGIKNTVAMTSVTFTGTQDIETAVTAIDTDATDQHLLIVGKVTMGTTIGNIAFQWAQNTSSAEDTIVRAGSMIQVI